MMEKELIIVENDENNDNNAKLIVKTFDTKITGETTVNFTLTVNYKGCQDIYVKYDKIKNITQQFSQLLDSIAPNQIYFQFNDKKTICIVNGYIDDINYNVVLDRVISEKCWRCIELENSVKYKVFDFNHSHSNKIRKVLFGGCSILLTGLYFGFDMGRNLLFLNCLLFCYNIYIL